MTPLLNDGLLKLGPAQLACMQLAHLMSGLDDDAADDQKSPTCGGIAPLAGYTEWISVQAPQVTLGWDWQLDPDGGQPRVVRQGMPRTNVQVLDSADQPLPWEQSLQVLATFIDRFDWNTSAFDAVCKRYA